MLAGLTNPSEELAASIVQPVSLTFEDRSAKVVDASEWCP
jgi:hypothetical protein